MKIVFPGNDSKYLRVEKEQFAETVVKGEGNNRYYAFPVKTLFYPEFFEQFWKIVDKNEFKIQTNENGLYVVVDHWLRDYRTAKAIALRVFLSNMSDVELTVDQFSEIMDSVYNDKFVIEM